MAWALAVWMWCKTIGSEYLPDSLLLHWTTLDFGFTITRSGYLLMALVLTSILVGHFVMHRWPAIREKRRANSPEERLYAMLPLLEQVLVDVKNETIDESLVEELGIRARELGIGINATKEGRIRHLEADLPYLIACTRSKKIKAARNYTYHDVGLVRVDPDAYEGHKSIFRPSYKSGKGKGEKGN